MPRTPAAASQPASAPACAPLAALVISAGGPGARRWLLLLAFGSLAAGLLSARAGRAAGAPVLISAVYYDTYLPNEPDEAVQLTNVSGLPVALQDWTLSDGEGTITFTQGLDPGASAWIANQAASFALEFGFAPDYEYGADSDPAVPNLARTASLLLGNAGDELVLRAGTGDPVDTVVWENGNYTNTVGWSGASVQPYAGASFGLEGQILYRRLDEASGHPVPDTDTAADWAQTLGDVVDGRKVRYPGWDLERYFHTAQFTQTATLTYTLAPDNIYATVSGAIAAAASSLRYEGYDFNNADLGEALAERAGAGVSVTLLLEGGPVGGIGNQERWICQQIEAAGGACWFMINDSAAMPPIHDRYAFQHAKFMLIDDRWLFTGSENLNYTSMPADDKSDGTSGNRGVWLWTDAPGPIAHAADVFAHDLDPAHHRDVRRWSAGDPTYGAPPAGFTPSRASGGSAYQVLFPAPFVFTGTIAFELVQAPDNALRSRDALLGLVARAGAGDTVLVEQLYEDKYWGPASSDPVADPNPRLEAYLAAARRGARVRLLLDSAYDVPTDPRSNAATCAYVNAIAAAEALNLACLTGNPTGTGIHNKMVLVNAGGRGWVHTGSLNGSENSSKQNRELAVQVESLPAYQALAQVFWLDWALSGGADYRLHLPLVLR